MAKIDYMGKEGLTALISHIPDLDVSFGIKTILDPDKPRKVTLAQKYPVFTGTYSEYEAETAVPDGTIVILTDSDHSGLYKNNNGELINLVKPSLPEVDGVTIEYNDDEQLTVIGGGSITVDSELSETSENALQNKVITYHLNQIYEMLASLGLTNVDGIINQTFEEVDET